MDLNFEIYDQTNSTKSEDTLGKFAECGKNLRCKNRNSTLNEFDGYFLKNKNIITFVFTRNYDFLISINSIRNLKNLEFVKEMNFGFESNQFEKSKMKVNFGEEIFFPLFYTKYYIVKLNIVYSDEKYCSDLEDIELICDVGYVLNNVRNNEKEGERYLNIFLDKIKNL
jgi:hypothetical protein